MWRFMHAAAIAALIGSAAYVYGVKYRTIYASEQLVKTRHLIDKEKDAINLLRAEYAHLARPDRVQALADSKLGLQPLALSQIATVDELPEARPKVDSIGRTLESLGFPRDTATPSGRRRRHHSPGEVRMAETPTDAGAKPKAPRRPRFKPADALADAAIAWLRRYAPKNFGVDLEPPAAGAARPSLARSHDSEGQGLRPRTPVHAARPVGRAHPHPRARDVRGLRRDRREAPRARPVA